MLVCFCMFVHVCVTVCVCVECVQNLYGFFKCFAHAILYQDDKAMLELHVHMYMYWFVY